MRTVKVRKDELIEKLRSNREVHAADYKAACEGYAGQLIEKVKAACRKTFIALDSREKELIGHIESQRFSELGSYTITISYGAEVELRKPEDHTYDYDVALKMAEMEVEDIIELNQAEFQQFVMDDWAWKEEFNLTNRSYGVFK